MGTFLKQAASRITGVERFFSPVGARKQAIKVYTMLKHSLLMPGEKEMFLLVMNAVLYSVEPMPGQRRLRKRTVSPGRKGSRIAFSAGEMVFPPERRRHRWDGAQSEDPFRWRRPNS
jgi:hypothetical protein